MEKLEVEMRIAKTYQYGLVIAFATISLAFQLSSSSLQAQNVGYSDHKGRVVDAETGKPLPNVKITHAIGGQSDADGRFTIRYYHTESDLRVFLSHPGYCTDTFSFAPAFVSLRRMTAQSQKNRPKVGVVLSGGGAKGVAHISALRTIEEAGIPIDIICGTSMGSLIGALYSIGYSTSYLDSLVRAQDWTTLLSDRADPSGLTLHQREEQNTYALIRGIDSDRPQQGGLIRGRNLMRLFQRLCSGYLDSISFDSLPIPFACVATDLVTNTEVDFRSGSLVRAMRASMAIPGVFTPVRIGESVLVDGGLRNNYPADLARRMGADIIIGVTVQGSPLKAADIGDAATVMMQIIDINTKHKYQDNIEMSDLVMTVDVSGYSAASFTSSAIDTLLRRGRTEALSHWDELLELRRSNGIDSIPVPIKAPQQARQDSLYTLQRPTMPTIPIVSAGFRFDTEEMGAIQLNLKYPFGTSLPMGLSGTLRLGRRIMARASYSLLTRHTTFHPTLSYTFRNNDIDIYTSGTRTHNIRYYQHTADFSPLDLRFRHFEIHAGLRWDYFDYYGQLLASDGTISALSDDHYLSYYATADLNNEDQWYFPTRGTRFSAIYHYRTTDFVTYHGGIGISDINAHWRINITPIPRLTLQPMLYSRLLLANQVPVAYRNAVGGEWFAHTVEQQAPFAGIGHLEYLGNNLFAAQMQLQLRVLSRHYILMRFAAAIQDDTLTQLFSHPAILGMQLGYSYNTLFGPIDLRIGYSNRTLHPYFLLNIGHLF